MQVFKNKIVIISIFILIALIILVYTQFLSPVSFSLNSANWYVVDDIEFNSINYHYSEEYKNSPSNDTQYLTDSEVLPSNDKNDYVKVFYNVKAKNKSIFDIVQVDSMVYEIDDKYKDRFLYSYSASCIMVQSVNRLGNSLIPCDVYIYVGGLEEEEIKDLIKSISLKLIYQTEFFGTRTKILDTRNVNEFINSPYILAE
ncbi:MAG TPA: hypothetical protein DCE02_07020 [Ruminiclostridium sp.]|jgi:hypothetical protein|uniref:Uncharacterized protein n=1 Tax=Acetivibrio saccincola TaxID=1677857 RepID=A0A2K9E6J3_9FIRM|nr:hypothetical protein [Acetivibrio saccincola]AUG58008.1 hypothetical protein HVS_10565 [Acetivibrio saccincola]NLW28203.1 hypothetical protein [Acetivibrio saccincola]PQQ67899.1 hypothetical protein B9R14_14790 [Acetivibrio saccincola]HAA43734.1 hypothetical protein [Ruminiclostridium sp.]